MSDIVKIHDMEWYTEVPRSIRKQTTFGLIMLALTFGGFGTWAFTAPLAAAVISQGSFVATGQNKIVQHLEGGIIREILVTEGDQVAAGQPLILLDETAALARERQLFLQRIRLETIAARLKTQASGDERIQLPEIISENLQDPETAEVVDRQQIAFDAWQAKLDSEIALLERNIEALRFRADGYGKQHQALEQQLKLLHEEFEGKNTLFKKGLLRNTEIKAIQRAIADATGQIGRLGAETSETFTQINKQHQQIEQVKNAYREDALKELQDVQADLDAVREQFREATNILQRSSINAPAAGTVVRLHYHTPGGVIESGKGILEILPAGVPLIIETQVPRNEIDNVKRGQNATVRLVALNQRTTPVLEGEVIYVSADALPAEGSGQSQEYYLARVHLPAEQLARVRNFTPTPGMPAEVLIQTEERTFFSYLTKPIVDSMSRAFTEQ